MKTSIWLPTSSALVLILSGCTNQNDPNDLVGTGPYDAQGHYIEELADDPTKWRKPGKKQASSGDDLPMIAQNDQPPLSANPLSTSSQKLPPAVVDSVPKETKRQTGQEVEIASRSRSTSSAGKSKSRPTASTSELKRSSKSSSSSRSKSKSKTTRHTVKKGDSLSSIAKKYGSSVSAIQKANGLSGTLIRDGKTLVVPKR